MLIVPEIETVVILVPRTGSTALKNALRAKYPKSMLLYRHMEADGVPRGYDRWRRVGVVRDPVARLYSLYKFMRDLTHQPNWAPGWSDRMNAAASIPFERWLVENQTVFTDPYVDGGREPGFWPTHAVLHFIPENRKSQFIHLRPDLGTEIWRYNDLPKLAANLGVELRRENESGDRGWAPAMHTLPPDAAKYAQRVFAWDLAPTGIR